MKKSLLIKSMVALSGARATGPKAESMNQNNQQPGSADMLNCCARALSLGIDCAEHGFTPAYAAPSPQVAEELPSIATQEFKMLLRAHRVAYQTAVDGFDPSDEKEVDEGLNAAWKALVAHIDNHTRDAIAASRRAAVGEAVAWCVANPNGDNPPVLIYGNGAMLKPGDQLYLAAPSLPDVAMPDAQALKVDIAADSAYINGLQMGWRLCAAGEVAKFHGLIESSGDMLREARRELAAQPAKTGDVAMPEPTAWLMLPSHTAWVDKAEAEQIMAACRHQTKLLPLYLAAQPAEGSAPATAKCRYCNGDGEHYQGPSQYRDCEACDGTGLAEGSAAPAWGKCQVLKSAEGSAQVATAEQVEFPHSYRKWDLKREDYEAPPFAAPAGQQDANSTTTIVQDVAHLFRACGFDVREEPSRLDPKGEFAISGSLDAGGLLVESVIEHCENLRLAGAARQGGNTCDKGNSDAAVVRAPECPWDIAVKLFGATPGKYDSPTVVLRGPSDAVQLARAFVDAGKLPAAEGADTCPSCQGKGWPDGKGGTMECPTCGRSAVAAEGATPAGDAPKLAYGHREDFYLLANAKRLGLEPIHAVKGMPNWVLAKNLFATGSTSARQICHDAGIDPDGYQVARIDGDKHGAPTNQKGDE